MPSFIVSTDFGWLFWLLIASLLLNLVACMGCFLYVKTWFLMPVVNAELVFPPLPPTLAAEIAAAVAPVEEVTPLVLPWTAPRSGRFEPIPNAYTRGRAAALSLKEVQFEVATMMVAAHEGWWFCPFGEVYHMKQACHSD